MRAKPSPALIQGSEKGPDLRPAGGGSEGQKSSDFRVWGGFSGLGRFLGQVGDFWRKVGFLTDFRGLPGGQPEGLWGPVWRPSGGQNPGSGQGPARGRKMGPAGGPGGAKKGGQIDTPGFLDFREISGWQTETPDRKKVRFFPVFFGFFRG